MQARIKESTYFGIPTLKNPCDLWVYREIICEQRPDVIVEIGNLYGGSTLALAHILQILGHGRVIAVDLSHKNVSAEARIHPLIDWIEGDAVESFGKVLEMIGTDESVMVIDDSSHTYMNTYKVLQTYSGLVKSGGYFIVEDGIVGHGIPGTTRAYEAVHDYIENTGLFDVDQSREWPMTWNPCGFLKKK